MNKANLLKGIEGEEKLLISHLLDLAEKCEKAGVVMYSPFLNPKELSIAVSRCKGDFYIKSFGGYDDAERRIIAFCPYEDSQAYYPISAVKVTAKDGSVYSHRDYMGAVLNLGIKREKLGDIIVENSHAILFCDDLVAEFICLNLSKVASANVTCEICSVDSVQAERKYSESTSSVASMRLDCILSAAIGKSRDAVCTLIDRGLVQVNYDIAKSTSARIKSGDVISARGFGKMIIETDLDTTRKGRVKINIKKFV